MVMVWCVHTWGTKKKKTLNDLLKVMFAVLSPSVVSVAWRAPLSMGILQASILEWVAVLSSRGSSQPNRGSSQVLQHDCPTISP